MKLLQKILSHGLLIAFLVALFFLYQERTELFPQWFGQSAQHASAPVKAVTKAPAPAPIEPEPAPVAAEPAPVAVVDDVLAAAATPSQEQPAIETIDEPVAVTPAATDRPAPVFRPLDDEEPAESTPAADSDTAAADDNVAASVAVTPPVAEQPEAAPETAAAEQQSAAVAETLAEAAPIQELAPVIAPVAPPVAEATPAEEPVAAPQADGEQAAVESAEPVAQAPDTAPAAADPVFQSRLEQARSLFWQRNTRAALQAYRALTADYPDSAQAWGELGNLYFNLRQAPAAAGAYARAIDLLIAQGEFMQAHQLLGVMYRLNTRQARQLETRLRQAGG